MSFSAWKIGRSVSYWFHRWVPGASGLPGVSMSPASPATHSSQDPLRVVVCGYNREMRAVLEGIAEFAPPVRGRASPGCGAASPRQSFHVSVSRPFPASAISALPRPWLCRELEPRYLTAQQSILGAEYRAFRCRA
jgi:hypothetical protein